MIRGFEFGLALWFIISTGLFIFWNSSGENKVSTFKCVLYGLLTASITVSILGGIVVFFN